MKSILWIKNFGPLYSAWPKKSWPMMKRSLGQKIFFAIFGTFGRYVTYLRGTFVEIVKKVQNQPTLVHSTILYCTWHTKNMARTLYLLGIRRYHLTWPFRAKMAPSLNSGKRDPRSTSWAKMSLTRFFFNLECLSPTVPDQQSQRGVLSGLFKCACVILSLAKDTNMTPTWFHVTA
jgi:hypothetical protein